MKTIRNTTTLLCLGLIASIGFQACTKDDDLNNYQTEVTVTLNNPPDLEEVEIADVSLMLKEINSGETLNPTEQGEEGFQFFAPAGSYDVTLTATITYSREGQTYTGEVRGFEEGFVVTGSETTVELDLFLYNDKAGFVLSEIYFAGSVTPENKVYNGDKYFIIYNNSDEVLYADGLIFAESDFVTTEKREYTPDVMSSAFTSNTLVVIPGNGEEYPVQPGGSVVVANNAINHKEYNPNSIDLSGADFELTLIPSINVDNPQVPDLINVSSFLTMHNQGFKSYVLARFDGDIESFKASQFYEYNYDMSNGSIRTVESYQIPNEWIVDAVNLSVESVYEWIVTAPSLDMGWTYCGKVRSDEDRFGKSVRRKVQGTENGREILQDTNNSTEDFEPQAELSLAN